MIKVVCGIIYKDKKIFICRRKPSISLGGYWEFPGGKIEQNENPQDSLKRELLEELQMEVEVMNYFETSKYDYGNFSIELIAYVCKYITWSLNLSDHDQHEWVDPEKLLEWNFAPADIPLARRITEEKTRSTPNTTSPAADSTSPVSKKSL